VRVECGQLVDLAVEVGVQRLQLSVELQTADGQEPVESGDAGQAAPPLVRDSTEGSVPLRRATSAWVRSERARAV
jgi:hypothetical protein